MTEVLQDTTEFQADWPADAAIILGRDYLEATGCMPEPQHFVALHYNGYFDYDPANVIGGRFSNWQEFESAVADEYGTSQREKETEIQNLIETIELDKQIGAIDPRLLLEFEGKDGLYRSTGAEVANEEKIRRYYAFKIVEKLTESFDDPNTPSTSPLDPLSRRTSIVLGINVENGKKIGSTFSEIAKSKKLTVAEVAERFEFIAHDESWIDHVEPELHANHLKDVVNASNPSFNLRGDLRPLHKLDTPEFYINVRTKQVILGRLAVSSVLNENYRLPSNTYKIGELLVRESTRNKPVDPHTHRYRTWTNEDKLNYAEWLARLIEPYNRLLTGQIIINAHRLGLGPSKESFRASFGNLAQVYQRLDIPKPTSPGAFDHLTLEEVIEYVRSIAEENDGKLNGNLIDVKSKESRGKLPNANAVRRIIGSDRILEVAGIPWSSQPKSAEDCIMAGLVYAEENDGKIPSYDDMARSPNISIYSIYKYCGNMLNFKKLVARALNEKSHQSNSGAIQDRLAA